MPGRILVLDDEENYAEMLQGLLKDSQFLVDMATKPEIALEALEERSYALVISDYKMPIMDGAVFLKKAREIYPDLPFILVSGLMNTPELVKVANMGVTLVLEKPLDTTYFLEQVKRFVQPMSEEEVEAAESGEYSAEPETPSVRGSGSKVYTFPKELKYLSAENEASKRYIQEAWENQQNATFMFFTGPEGSEFEIILQEIAHWKKQDGLNHQYFSASQLLKETTQQNLKQIPDDDETCNVVAVGDISDLTADEQSELIAFLHKDVGALPGGGELTFVFWVDNLKGLSMDLQVEMRGSMIKVPPLGRRYGEIAVYTRRYLETFSREQGRPEPPELSGAAKNLLLQYPWNGNFSQLVKVLKKSVKVMTDESLPYEALRAILAPMDDTVELPLEGGNLEEALIRRQQDIIREAADQQGTQTRAILSKLGFDVSSMPPEMGIENLDLLYPELLEPKGH